MATTTHNKHFTLYSHRGGPNPWKVAIVLEELGLDYHTIFVEIGTENKQPPYTTLCPNGRLPTLVDHKNNDFAIWESGAIILYLVGKYDPERKLSFGAEGDDAARAVQWLMFQMSGELHLGGGVVVWLLRDLADGVLGQGPYYGQAMWFSKYNPGNRVRSSTSCYCCSPLCPV